MKKLRWLAAGVLVILLAGLVLWRTGGERTVPSSPPAAHEPAFTMAAPAPTPAVIALGSGRKEISTAEQPASSPFENWARQFAAADPVQRSALLAEGETLAKVRRVEMAQLIRTNPEQAIEQALPYDLRKQLPESVQKMIEQPVHGRGDLSVFGAYPLAESKSDFQPVQRELKINGQKYKPYFYGARLHTTTRSGISVHGVAVGPEIAVGDPVKPLSKLEASDLQGGNVPPSDPVCSVSGLAASSFGDTTYGLLGNQVIQFCHQSHLIRFNQQLLIGEGKLLGDSGDPGGFPTNVPPDSAVNFTQGRKTLLFIRLRFPDDPTEPITESGAQSVMNGVNKFFVDSSYNTLSIVSTISPLVTLPQPKQWYGDVGGTGQLLADGRRAVRDAGYDFRDYDLDIVAFVTVPNFDFGGLAFVGARGVWLQSIGTGVAAHELGHNLGLLHANFWKPGGANGPPNPLFPNPNYPLDSGSLILHDDINAPGDTSTAPKNPPGDVEYGDPYDTMGSAGAGIFQFSAHAKYDLNWLSDRYVRTVTANETNRLYSFDAPLQTTGRVYALRIKKDFQREYWVDHRSLWTSNPWQSSGVELHWQDWVGTAGTSQLLDTTPGSAYGKEDCAVVVGRTFTDRQTGMHITPVAKGGSGTEEWIDVVVKFGGDPANSAPTVSVSSDVNAVAVGGVINFSVDATDADGDPVAYHWEFGDSGFGSNLSSVSHAFATAGKYVVRCEVSDLHGGVGSAQLVVTVGATNAYVIGGQVIDNNGTPLEGIRVHNGAQGAGYHVGWSDSQGYYVIGNVAPGNYTNFAFNYGSKPLPLFANPVQVTAQDVGGLDHLVQDFPHVSVAAVSNAFEVTLAPGQFTFTRTGSTANDLQVFYVVSGTAVRNFQYTAFPSNFVVIPAGQLTTTLDVTPLTDGVSTGPSTVTVTLRLATNEVRISSVVTNISGTNVIVMRTNNITFPGWELIPVNGQLTWFQTYPQYVIGHAEDTVTIADADPDVTPGVSLFAADDTAVETGSDSATLIVVRSGSVAADLTVHYVLGPGPDNPATSDDYIPVSGVVTILAGETTAFFSVIARDDLFVEGNETLIVQLVPSADYQINNGSAQLLIVDDDLPLVTVNATDAIAAEPGGNPGTFTFTRQGDVSGSLVVNYLVTGTAVSGADFQALPNQIIIPAGQISASVNVVPVDDGVTEGDETVVLFISESPTYNIGNPSGATVVIQDNELPTVTLAVTDGAAAEPANVGVITLTRTGPTTGTLKVNFFVGGTAIEQADYGSIGTNITFAIGAATTNIIINPINDSFREVEETVIVRLVGGTNYNLGATTAGTVTLGDDDGSNLPAVGFMLKSFSVLESAGKYTIPVMISAAPTVQRGPALVQWRITGGSAVQDIDYTLASTGYLSFNSNVPIVTNLVVGLINNPHVDGPRTLLITLYDPERLITNRVVNNGVTNFVISAVPTNAFLGSYRTFTLNILDEDTNIVTVAATTPLAREQGGVPGYFTITRAGPTNRALTVTYAITGTASSRTDYSALGNQITIPAGSFSAVVPIVPVDDGVEEYVETIQLRLISAVSAQIGFPDVALINIQDNDGTVQFTLPNYDVLENIGVAQIPVQRTGDTNLAVSVSFAATAGSATAGVDFIATNGTLAFLPGEVRKNIPVTIINDLAVETNETINLVLSLPTGGVLLGGQKTAVINIVNDDTAFDFAAASFRVPENDGFAEMVIIRSGVVTNTDTIFFRATNGTAGPLDFGLDGFFVTFPPGETNQSVYLDLFDDTLFEGDETVNLSLSLPGPGTQLGPQSNAVLVIVDDECRLEFEVAGYSVLEYAPFVTLTVRRTGGTVNPVSVTATTSNGTATNGLDYVPVSNVISFTGDHYEADTNGVGNLVFVPGETVRTINISLLDDTLGEGDETFFVTLSNPMDDSFNSFPDSTLLGTNVVATVTILDNETPGNVDYEFNPGAGANDLVRAVAVAPRGGLVDFLGRVVIGGDFTAVDGIALNRVARLLPNGALDTAFNPGAGLNGSVHAVLSQPDGRVLVGGEFTTVNNTNRLRVARLNADGKLDLSFNPGPLGVNGIVRAIAQQADGKVVIGGDFSQVGGVPRGFVARLETNGVLDTNFTAALNGAVNALAIQVDGKVIVGGAFTVASGTNRASLARLNTNGTLDASLVIGTGFDGPINALALQNDGKILAGGSFTNYNGTNANNLVRLTTTGLFDNTFKIGSGPDAAVRSISFALGGKAVIGGDFTHYNANPRAYFTRLAPNGSVDILFHMGTGADAPVRAVVAQEDSAIVIGGDFTSVNGLPRNHIARVHGDEKLNLTGVEFASGAYSVAEDGVKVTITVQRTGYTNRAFTVDFRTINGTATSPGDYAATNGTLSFALGEMAKTFDVRVFDDLLVEGDETVSLLLDNPSSNVIDLSGVASAQLVIIDTAKSVAFSAPTYTVAEAATNAVITLVRAGSLNGSVTVGVSTFDVSATAALDYTGLTNVVVTFTNGQNIATVLVPINNDGLPESSETLRLQLSAGTAQTGLLAQAVLTITDDDPGPGAADTTFSTGATSGSSRFVRALALQLDGRVLVGGAFTNFAGSSQNYLARLGTNGVVDTSFTPGLGPNALVSGIGLSPDGHIAAGGAFSAYNGMPFNRLVRLTTNGLPEPTFNQPSSFDSAINALAAQPDGKMVVGGNFKVPAAGFARLRVNGTLDLQFDPATGADAAVLAVALRADGQVLIGGAFTNVGGFVRPRLALLATNGAVDATFPGVTITNGNIFTLAFAPGGKILLGGNFRFVNGLSRSGVARLNADGSLDTTFDPGAGVPGTVYTVAALTNGSVFIGGDFTTVNGTNRNRYALLRPDGSVSRVFDSRLGADSTVFTSVVTPDQKVIIGGDFTTVGGLSREGVARINTLAAPSLARLTGPRISGGAAQLTVTTTPNYLYILEGSSDLLYWLPLSTNVATGITLDFSDPAFAGSGRRFYRVRVEE